MYFYKENKQLKSQVNKYFEDIKVYFETGFKNEISILLIGSMSRGEASWIFSGKTPVLISDIEFFIIHNIPIDKNEITTQLKKIEDKVFNSKQLNAFHIDFSFIKKTQLSKLEKKLIVFEAKEYGKTIVGKDYKYLLPDVTIDNINLYDIKDIMNHRMFSFLYYGVWKRNSISQNEYKYIMAKNSLDLLTVELIKDNNLIPGFVKRLKALKEENSKKEFYKTCANIKLSAMDMEKYNILDHEEKFLKFAKDLYFNFNIQNNFIIYNKIPLLKRILGRVKRMIILKKIVFITPKSHFNNMIKECENVIEPNSKDKILRNHYILYGYPMSS